MEKEILFQEPLVEKYRPYCLDEIIGNKNEIQFLKFFLKNDKIPNLILCGEPGAGKTSAVLALAREYLGEYFEELCLELNASDDRGIDTVRTKTKFFAQKKINSRKKKIIILDESDNMTSIAQNALRNTIDIYEDQVRFFFTCNTIENIIDAIQSRCKIMFFGKITDEEMVKKIKDICKKEKINIRKDGIKTLLRLSDNSTDMRSILNIIELLRANYLQKEIIKNEDIYEICDKPSPLIINNVLQDIINKDCNNAIEKINHLKNDGFLNSDIVTTFINEILKNDNFNEMEKEKLLSIITKYNLYFLDGYDSFLQIGSMIVKIYQFIHNL